MKPEPVLYLKPYVDFRRPAPKPEPLYQRLTNLLTRSRAL